MALSVIAVSISVSPLRIEDDDTDMFITSAPSRLPASSNEACVRVEASKNMLIRVRPRSDAVFFSIWRLSSTNSSARSSRPTMSSRESPSIPSKWRLLRTNEDLWAMFIKAEPIGAAGCPGKGAEAARSRGPQARRGTVAPAAVPGNVMAARIGTDEVFNQSPPYQDVDLFGSDPPLREAVAANGAGGRRQPRWQSSAGTGARPRCSSGPARQREPAEAWKAARSVEFHPAYHDFMAESMREGLHASDLAGRTARRAAAPAEVARAARFYMVAQVENGHMCPITMTRASVAALAAAPALRGAVMPKIAARATTTRASGRGREKSGHHARHGHDREAGRHRCARQHHARRARWRCLPDHRPQVVHVGADVRRVPGAGAGATQV